MSADELEYVHQRIMRAVEEHLGGPVEEHVGGPSIQPPDDSYSHYLSPRLLDWWENAGRRMPPTLLVVCGIDGCGSRLADVHTDAADPELVVVKLWQRLPDRVVPAAPPAALLDKLGQAAEKITDATGRTLADMLRARQADYDARTLRRLGARRVAKRYTAPELLVPLEVAAVAVCPVHWQVSLDPAVLRAELARTRHAVRRRIMASNAAMG
ncbi:MAG: hypothetical protein QJR12_09455 [Mycobacterium sp.]|uniref:hypothetical protein n=1 Tax=Mycobacterium sp. TaxID=1785 RepID=UPI00262A53DB|nr:hypothetical protein [Mycobacterium sp.]MDI3314486.1 hypothetical protein [Mycobacterium sp.]